MFTLSLVTICELVASKRLSFGKFCGTRKTVTGSRAVRTNKLPNERRTVAAAKAQRLSFVVVQLKKSF